MSEIKIFTSPEFGEIRTSGTSEQPLFCLADVCKTLDLQTNKVKKRLSERGWSTIPTPTYNQHGAEVMLDMTYIDEPNLYKCIFQSRKKEAEVFQNWVTSEVLPSIRKSGGYMVARETETNEELLARAVVIATDAIKRKDARISVLETENANQRKELIDIKVENEQLKSRQTYMDVVLSCKSTVIVTSIAQDYGMSAKAFNILLRNYGIQHKVGGQWILYSKYLDCGYVNSRPVTIEHADGTKTVKFNTEWTQKGRFFIYNTLKSNGVLPLIERTI